MLLHTEAANNLRTATGGAAQNYVIWCKIETFGAKFIKILIFALVYMAGPGLGPLLPLRVEPRKILSFGGKFRLLRYMVGPGLGPLLPLARARAR